MTDTQNPTEPFDLHVARMNKGWSTRDLATEAGVSRTTVEKLEAGLSVRPAKAKAVADVFGVQVSDVMELIPARLRDAS